MFWTIVLVMTSIGLGQSNLTDLYLMGLVPMEGHNPTGESVKIGANVALEEINSHNNVLPGYRLNILWNDTKCDPITGIAMMISNVFTQKKKNLMVLGAGCSEVSVETARTSRPLHLVQMSWGSTTPVLSNKTKYPFFFRGISPETKINQLRIQFFKKLGWNKISVIYQSLFVESVNDLKKQLHYNKMDIIRSEMVYGNPRRQIEILKNHDARIIVVFFYERLTRAVMCEAFKIGLYGPKIIWILMDFLDSRWQHIDPTENLACTTKQLQIAADGYFTIALLTYSRTPVVTVGGLDVTDLLEVFRSKTNGTLPYEFLYSTPLSYDSTWCMALALNATQARLAKTGNRTFNDLKYDDELPNLIVQEMKNIHFTGIRGTFFFNENFDQIMPMAVMRYEDGVLRIIAQYDERLEGSKRIQWLSSISVKWKDGSIPKDSTTTRKEVMKLSLWLYILMCCLSGLGLCQSVFFLAFNIYQREKKIVKMSSLPLNTCMLIGCVFLLIVPFLQEFISEERAALCEAKIILMVIGFSLLFGALFAKIWRVNTMLSSVAPMLKGISDSDLLLMIVCYIIVNGAVLCTWFVEHPIKVKISERETEKEELNDIHVIKKMAQCVSKEQTLFTIILIGIQTITVILGAFKAYEKRKVMVKGLHDSKLIAACIYHVSVFSIIYIILLLVLRNELNLYYALTSVIIITTTVVTQNLIILPMMLSIWTNNLEKYSEWKRITKHAITAHRLAALETVMTQKLRLIEELEGQVSALRGNQMNTSTQTD